MDAGEIDAEIGHGRKNDDADALSVGVAALTSRTLKTAEPTPKPRRCAPSWSTATTW